MNNRLVSFRRRPLAVAMLLAHLAAATTIVRGQTPMVIPPGAATPAPAAAQAPRSSSADIYYKVTGVDDHVKMVVNTSRFLTLERKIPQVQVNNPDVLDVTPVSPCQVQISAKRTGVTQVNLWGDDKRIYTVNVVVTGDAAELAEVLRSLFPKTTLTIVPVHSNSVIISGYVDQQDAVPKIVAVASKYFPEVINNMTVSGVQQAVLHVKVFEVSRSKLRNMGFDWTNINTASGTEIWSGINGLLSSAQGPGTVTAPDNTFRFSTGGANAFLGVLNALRQDDLAKLLSEPDLVAISGRPAYMLVGGEIGYQTTNAITGTIVGFKEYGTRLDFVPIVLGNGRLHMDIRTRVSEPDAANSIDGIPALKTREVETGVELRVGQTLAIAGLLERRVEASNQGLPWISELPYLGVPFRSVSHSTNEVELVVLVTPQVVDGLEPGQVPNCMPGTETADPNDWQLFFKGFLEVPKCCLEDAVAVQRCGVAGGGVGSGRAPVDRQNPQNPTPTDALAANPQPTEPGFIGPIGYDVLK